MRSGILFALMILLSRSLLFCQYDARQDYRPGINTTEAAYNAFLFSIDYASNTNVLGNFNDIAKQPSISPSIVFFSELGADLSLLGYFIDNSDDSLESFTAEADIMLGYTIRPFKGFTIYPSYAHYFYSRNSNSLKSVFSDDFRLDMDFEYKIINTGLSAGYFTGKQHTFYTSFHNYYRLEMNNFPFKNSFLTIQPGIDLNFGDYEYLNLYYLDEIRTDQQFYTNLLAYPSIRRYVFIELQKNPDLTYKDVLDAYLEEKAEDSFKLTSVGLSLPFYFMTGNFIVNLGLFVFIPVNQPDFLTGDPQFFFNFGLSYNLVFN